MIKTETVQRGNKAMVISKGFCMCPIAPICMGLFSNAELFASLERLHYGGIVRCLMTPVQECFRTRKLARVISSFNSYLWSNACVMGVYSSVLQILQLQLSSRENKVFLSVCLSFTICNNCGKVTTIFFLILHSVNHFLQQFE